jgi:hypothetical protein
MDDSRLPRGAASGNIHAAVSTRSASIPPTRAPSIAPIFPPMFNPLKRPHHEHDEIFFSNATGTVSESASQD